MPLPKNLRYSEYVWAKVESDEATLGITDYGLKAAKEIVFVDLPKKGQKLKKGDVFTSLESVKWSGHIQSPVSGLVSAVNDPLFDDPALLNKSPYDSWICRIKLSDPAEAKVMMDSKAAGAWVKKNI